MRRATSANMPSADDTSRPTRTIGSTALALGFVWAVGIMLMIGPRGWMGKVRTTCVDAAAPGITLVHVADRRWIGPLRERWVKVIDQAEEVAVVDDAGAAVPAGDALHWQQQCEQLQVQLARAERDRLQTEARISSLDVQTAGFLLPEAAPLIADELIPANWIGQIGSADGTPHPLLSVGARDGIAIDELVLDDAAPHIDRGEQVGVEAQSLVLDGRRLIGKIVEVGRWTSSVQPITDPEFRQSVQLVRVSGDQALLGAKGVLCGHGDGACRLTYVDATQPVAAGDLVVTPGDDPHVPAMLLCGRVVDASLSDGSLEWTITVEPAVALEGLSHVAILHQTIRDSIGP